MIYGHDGTVHSTKHLHVETDPDGKVVSAWFRCCMIPFEQVEVDYDRAAEMHMANERVKHFQLNAIDMETHAERN